MLCLGVLRIPLLCLRNAMYVLCTMQITDISLHNGSWRKPTRKDYTISHNITQYHTISHLRWEYKEPKRGIPGCFDINLVCPDNSQLRFVLLLPAPLPASATAIQY